MRASLALAVAAVLGIVEPWPVDTLPGDAPNAEARRIDAELGPLSAALGPADRVALLVEDDQVTTWYATQYALAPAIVLPVRPRECAAPRPPSACVAGATHLLLPGVDGQRAAEIGRSMGFAPVAVSGATTLLARREP